MAGDVGLFSVQLITAKALIKVVCDHMIGQKAQSDMSQSAWFPLHWVQSDTFPHTHAQNHVSAKNCLWADSRISIAKSLTTTRSFSAKSAHRWVGSTILYSLMLQVMTSGKGGISIIFLKTKLLYVESQGASGIGCAVPCGVPCALSLVVSSQCFRVPLDCQMLRTKVSQYAPLLPRSWRH